VGESGATARMALIGAVAGVMVASAATWGNSSAGSSASAAGTAARPVAAVGSRPPAGPVPASTTSTPAPTRPPTSRPVRTTTTRALPVAPRATPLPPEGGRLAPAYSRLPITDKVVFLGIDDGAIRDPRTLAHLRDLRIPFSVFLTMGPAQEDPAFWRAAMAAGGTIQSHTLTHPDLTRVGAATLRQEVCGTLDPYERLFDRRPTLFRPPYGASNDAVRRQAAECGYKGVILWKGSTNNGRLTMQEGPLHAGDILLLHWRDTLRDDVDDVVARCRQEGFTVARLEDYLG
jgi:peptidoglycan/xylan/chitin deacetylase (PgdA/CDA1 family)